MNTTLHWTVCSVYMTKKKHSKKGMFSYFMAKYHLLFITLQSSMSLHFCYGQIKNLSSSRKRGHLKWGFWYKSAAGLFQWCKETVCSSARKHRYVLLVIKKEDTQCSQKYTVHLHRLTRNHSITLQRGIYLGMPETDLFCIATKDACGIRFQPLGKQPGIIEKCKVKM